MILLSLLLSISLIIMCVCVCVNVVRMCIYDVCMANLMEPID